MLGRLETRIVQCPPGHSSVDSINTAKLPEVHQLLGSMLAALSTTALGTPMINSLLHVRRASTGQEKYLISQEKCRQSLERVGDASQTKVGSPHDSASTGLVWCGQ